MTSTLTRRGFLVASALAGTAFALPRTVGAAAPAELLRVTTRTLDVRGRAALDEYWTGIRQTRSWKLDVLAVDGTRDMAWQLGRSTLVAGPEGSPPSVVDFLLVWKRQPDGALKIQVDFYHSAASR